MTEGSDDAQRNGEEPQVLVPPDARGDSSSPAPRESGSPVATPAHISSAPPGIRPSGSPPRPTRRSDAPPSLLPSRGSAPPVGSVPPIGSVPPAGAVPSLGAAFNPGAVDTSASSGSEPPPHGFVPPTSDPPVRRSPVPPAPSSNSPHPVNSAPYVAPQSPVPPPYQSSPPAYEQASPDAPAPAISEPPAAHRMDEKHASSPPVVDQSQESVPIPIRAMRVIKLTESSSSRPPAIESVPPASAPAPMESAPPAPAPQMIESVAPASAPQIETDESSLEDLADELDAEEIEALHAPSLPPAAIIAGHEIPVVVADDIQVDVEEPPDSVEVVDSVEDVQSVAMAPMPEPSVPISDRKPPPPRRSMKASLPAVSTPRKKPWWETLFGDDFSRAYRPMTQPQLVREVDFILSSLAVPKGAVILDLGCGQGEICVELARRGYSVVGYDLSVYQLAMAGDNAQQARQKINFLQGDIREMAFEQMFDAVICWDTTFGYFEDDKNIDVLHRIKNALKPNGRLILDIMNRDFAAREAPYNHWFEGDGCVCMDDMTLDWISNRLRVKRSIILDDGRSKELHYSTRLYTLSEIGRMLHDAGFRVAAVSGDVATRGAFFGPHSRRIIIEAGKP